jgi:hypothetical protein
MKKIVLLWLGIGLFSPVLAQKQDEAIRLRAVHVYSDPMALLEYKGKVSGIRYDLPLPDALHSDEIVVRMTAPERLLYYTINEVVSDSKRPLHDFSEMLRENIGYSVSIEVFEGRESVSYAGEIMQLDAQSKVVFLRTNQTIETIPLANIQHISGGRGLNLSTKISSSKRQLSVFFVGEVNDEMLTILIPSKKITASALYLLDFDKTKPELTLDLKLESAVQLDQISVFYYGTPYQQADAGAYLSQAAFQLADISVPANQPMSFQILTTSVDMMLSDVAEVGAWEPGNNALTQSTRAVRRLAMLNNSPMNWFPAEIRERKSKSIGKIPGLLPVTPKGLEAKIEYGKSPFVLNDNARLVKISRKSTTISGMKYDSYLFEGKIDIRNTGTEAGRVKVFKQAVPENKRNYWFANVFLDLKGKTKQEVNRLEFEVKVEPNDATFYRYRYELLVPSEN